MSSGLVSLGALLASTPKVIPVLVTGDQTVEITGVAYDSNGVKPGTLFCCLQGEHFDGHEFATEAVQAGAILDNESKHLN